MDAVGKGEGVKMNLKEHVSQIYELRLIQSSKAFISFYKEIKIPFSGDITINFHKDGQIIEKLYNKLVIEQCRLTNKEIDKLLSIYLFYSYSVNQVYQSRTKCSSVEKYSIYLMAVSCIYKYYQIEASIYEVLNIEKDIIVEDIINACLIIRDLLTGLINYTLITNGKLVLEKEKNNILSKRFKDIREEDIQLIEQDVESFVNDYLEEVLYPVKFEFDRQVSYIQTKNKLLISRDKSVFKNVIGCKKQII